MPTAKERIEQLLYHYMLNIRELATELGYERAQILYDICSGKTQKISKTLSRRIMATYPELRPDWVRRGDGPMLRDEEDDEQPSHIIRYYPDVDASCGDSPFYDNPDENYMELNLPNFPDCQYAVNAFGDSMEPLIKSGSIVLLSDWNHSFIEWGKIYLVVTRDGYRCIKYLHPSKRSRYMVCRSEDSESHPDYEIDVTEIHRLFLVKAWITRVS